MLNSWNEIRTSINELRKRCSKLESVDGVEKDKELVLIRKRMDELDSHFASMREAVDFLKTVPKVENEMGRVDSEFTELHKLFNGLRREIERRFLE